MSTRHLKDELASEDENAKLGDGSLVRAAGPESIVVSGGVVSTLNDLDAGVVSM